MKLQLHFKHDVVVYFKIALAIISSAPVHISLKKALQIEVPLLLDTRRDEIDGVL